MASGADALASDGLVLRGVTKRYRSGRDETLAIDEVSVSVARGEFVTIIGPSGCGKSTVLRVAAGLVEADSGEVSVFGEDVRAACANKHIGFVPQSPALLPWRTVLENVRLPLQVNRRASAAAPARDPAEILAAFGLGGALDRRPSQLSGGMQQRVAIARAFAFDPAVLLMDEPFSALDELTREVIRYELLDLWNTRRTTVLFVTHSVAEAVALSDSVVVMSPSPGRVRAVVPVELPRPRDEHVELTDEFRAIERQVRSELRGEGPGDGSGPRTAPGPRVAGGEARPAGGGPR
ncbi:MAG: ABC transporter ATP-binding protein [Actinomycetota bacterium]|nr:ABC transporter ATP-binding protein [Actinomycetota bacterium]